jgi:thiosulfate dehydrogenase [quinone] large subunit
MMDTILDRRQRVIEDPPFVRALLNSTRWAWVWVPIRVYLAWVWLSSGWGKLMNPAWMESGQALRGFWERALATEPRPVITYDWYRAFIQYLYDTQSWTWFAKVIVFGELAVGLGLLLGAFTGIAAFGGMLLNFNFLLAGTVSTNPVLFVLELLVLLAWKVAGYWGIDRWLLPTLGVPWRLSRPAEPVAPPAAAAGTP